MLNKLLGNSDIQDTSDLVNEYLNDGEKIHAALKVWRDEVVITDKGLYIANAQGITGKKKTVDFYHKKELARVTFDNNYGVARDCEFKIHTRAKDVIVLNVKKKQSDLVVGLVKELKLMMD